MSDYRDLDMSMKANLYSDIDILTDVDAIEQAVKDILFTRIGEREDMPTYGSNLFATLMEKMGGLTTISIKENVSNALKNWEPRVNVLNVSVIPYQDENTYEVSIKVNIIRINFETEFNITLESIQ